MKLQEATNFPDSNRRLQKGDLLPFKKGDSLRRKTQSSKFKKNIELSQDTMFVVVKALKYGNEYLVRPKDKISYGAQYYYTHS